MITDHDVVSYPKDIIDESFTLLQGYESTSDAGHIVALGVDQVAPSSWSPRARIDHITEAGGTAIMAHPGWNVGWQNADMIALRGYTAIEVFNGFTETPERTQRAVQLWTEVLNARGWSSRIWAVAADDSHNPEQMNKGWVMVKAARLSPDAIRRSIEIGAFYASHGPSFSALGVLNGSIVASSPDAARIRFIDQNMNLLWEGPAGLVGLSTVGPRTVGPRRGSCRRWEDRVVPALLAHSERAAGADRANRRRHRAGGPGAAPCSRPRLGRGAVRRKRRRQRAGRVPALDPRQARRPARLLADRHGSMARSTQRPANAAEPPGTMRGTSAGSPSASVCPRAKSRAVIAQ